MVVDGVDGPLRHQCARMRLLQISDKEAVRGTDYPHWHGYVEAYFSVAWVPARASLGRDDNSIVEASQRHPAIFAVGEACFLQVEIAFDPPPDLVGDLAVAQQDVDEFPLRPNQFPRQLRPLGRDFAGIG